MDQEIDNKRKRDENEENIEKETKKAKDYIQINKEAIKALKKTTEINIKGEIICEKDVGITEFLNKENPGFLASIKQRFSDFIVNEIDESGNIVHLTKLTCESKKDENKDNTKTQEEKDNEAFELLKEIINDEKKINSIKEIVEGKGKNSTIVETDEIDSKEQRTKIHQFFRKHFSGRIDTETKKDSSAITIFWANGRGTDRRTNQRDAQCWRDLGGDFCQFTLYKENKETMNTIKTISRILHSSSKCFGTAGTKDKRGITTQKVTAYRISGQRLANANSELGELNIQLGDFKYVKRGLKLGDLKGNLFNLVLRELSVEEDIINNALESFKNVGFINYFGMQRFGTTSIPTHEIGKMILMHNWQKAVELILMPKVGENEKIQEARNYWKETKDVRGTLDKMPRYCVAEISILKTFLNMKSTNVYSNALTSIPRDLRMMYVHAYQSYIWNLAVSYHIREFGLKPVVGDLVLTKERKRFHDDNSRNHNRDKPEIITEENINDYTIYDVVLPLPGNEIIYPNNTVGEFYEKTMRKDGISPVDLKRVNRDYYLSGDYRKIVIKPENVEWSYIKYNDEKADLAISDLEKLNGKTEPESIPDGKYKALKVSFSLSSSTYATMALREITKMNTSIVNVKKQRTPETTESSEPEAPTNN